MKTVHGRDRRENQWRRRWGAFSLLPHHIVGANNADAAIVRYGEGFCVPYLFFTVAGFAVRHGKTLRMKKRGVLLEVWICF